MKQIIVVAALLLASTPVTAQPQTPVNETPVYFTYTNHEVNAGAYTDSSLYKRRSDWQRIVDQFWGPGLPRSQKQQVFDEYANLIHDRYPGFGGLNVNWDTLRVLCAQRINDSTSKGGLSAILSRLAHELRDHHVMAWDTIMQSTPLNPGVPIFALGLDYGDIRHFGAVLTPLPDSSLLVVRSVADHPLNLKPGDIVLGYEGVPWKRLAFELLNSPLPRLGPMGSAESARFHVLLVSAGMNWHIFDTIDVVRCQSGTIEHLPTASLSQLNIPEFLANNEQVSVPPVPLPDYYYLHQFGGVTHGIIQGTNIGYIYISKHSYEGVKAEFQNAVSSLMGTDGLILDLRFNAGGSGSAGPEAGLALLMNFSTPTLVGLERASSHELYGLRPTGLQMPFSIEADPGTVYERPIAALVGPHTLSRGEVTAYQFRYLPGVRLFGKPVNGALSGLTPTDFLAKDGFWLWCPSVVLVDHEQLGTPLLRREFPVDDPVWLTPEDVANGEDTVVKRALAWITTAVYAHNVQISRQGIDTLLVTARVENPLAHTLHVVVILNNDSGAIIDSMFMADDGLHGDSASADGLWGCQYVPLQNGKIHVGVRTDDVTAGTTSTLPKAAAYYFTRGALITVDTRTVDLGPISVSTSSYDTTFLVRNIGYAADSLTVFLDPGTVVPDTAVSAFPKLFTLAPGDSQKVTFRIRPNLLSPQYYVAQIIVEPKSASGPARFEKNYQFQVVVTGTGSDLAVLPTVYVLDQNYPNPFNSSTKMHYGLPNRSKVTLTVFNTLGQQAALLQNGEQDAGYHEVRFDASGFPSGVYFYRIQAGDFVKTRKLLLVR